MKNKKNKQPKLLNTKLEINLKELDKYIKNKFKEISNEEMTNEELEDFKNMFLTLINPNQPIDKELEKQLLKDLELINSINLLLSKQGESKLKISPTLYKGLFQINYNDNMNFWKEYINEIKRNNPTNKNTIITTIKINKLNN